MRRRRIEKPAERGAFFPLNRRPYGVPRLPCVRGGAAEGGGGVVARRFAATASMYACPTVRRRWFASRRAGNAVSAFRMRRRRIEKPAGRGAFFPLNRRPYGVPRLPCVRGGAAEGGGGVVARRFAATASMYACPTVRRRSIAGHRANCSDRFFIWVFVRQGGRYRMNLFGDPRCPKQNPGYH